MSQNNDQITRLSKTFIKLKNKKEEEETHSSVSLQMKGL